MNPQKTQDWEDRAAVILESAWNGKPRIQTPVLLLCEFIFPRLSNAPKSWPEEWVKPTLPDFDNLLKAAGDALKKGKILQDDGLIFFGVGSKYHAQEGEAPHVQIELFQPRTENHQSAAAFRASVDQQSAAVRTLRRSRGEAEESILF